MTTSIFFPPYGTVSSTTCGAGAYLATGTSGFLIGLTYATGAFACSTGFGGA
jgi:hypothetical protein